MWHVLDKENWRGLPFLQRQKEQKSHLYVKNIQLRKHQIRVFFFKLNMVRAKGKATKDKGKKKRKSKSKDSFTELRINLLPFC